MNRGGLREDDVEVGEAYVGEPWLHRCQRAFGEAAPGKNLEQTEVKIFFFFLIKRSFPNGWNQVQETNLCRCGPNVKSAVAGNRTQVAVFTAVSLLLPELDAQI